MNIKIVRLKSGEEILCDLIINDKDNIYTLKKPLIIIPQSKGQIGFMSWLPYAKTEDGVDIDKDFVAFIVEADKQLEDEYTSQTTGLVIPQSAAAGPIGIVP